MRGLFAKIMTLPIPGKAALGMLLAGGVYGVFAVLNMPQLGFMIGVAMGVVTVVLAIFAFIMEARDKKKAGEVEASIADSAAATPGGVNKVADRAKLDDLRRQFESGVQTFRDYGKSLYDMPWYVVVGEPGSGKTEAIRHSGIGFPPGLQDQLQGTGGTVNMNWWFTDQAVILDTAGRLLFEDVAPGENNEWREFLKLLRTSRPNCPINGMLLVIPADTLITDRTDEIEKKAGKIAQQFDQIQRSLGVRFPVFVLITKADLINGFREFFDDITDPRLTAQMMGWSNPADLDEAFRPDRVEEHLGSLRDHLLQRRFALLQDPVHSEDPKGRRIDQVDALYKFPEAITEIAPRLRRYLEMIFVAGEWSQKPLFLRGIYFTSSMRDGDALDADLAEVLGVGVGALPEGKLWERERSYFLRDVFLDKVFKERGLVTRAANAGQVKRKRAMLLAGAAGVASLLLGGMIWYSYSQTKARIQNPRDFWVALAGVVGAAAFDDQNATDGLTPAEAVRTYLSPIEEAGPYDDARSLNLGEAMEYANNSVEINGTKQNYLELFERARKYYEENSSSTGLFALVAALPGGGNDIFKRQLPTQRLLFEQLVLSKAADLARRDIVEGGRERTAPIGWGVGDSGPGVLSTLIAFEVDAVKGEGEPIGASEFEELVRFSLGGEQGGDGDSAPLDELSSYYEWLYADGAGWPSAALGAGSELAVEAVSSGIDAFNQRWRDPRGEGTLFGDLRALREAGLELKGAEDRLAGCGRALAAAESAAAFDSARDAWSSAYGVYESARRGFEDAFVAIDSQFSGERFRNSNIADEARLAVWESAKTAYDLLIGRFGDETEREKLNADNEAENRLLEWRESLVGARAEAESEYRVRAKELVEEIESRVVPDHLAVAGGMRAFARRQALYAEADSVLQREVPVTGTLAGVLEEIDRRVRAEIDRASLESNGEAGRVLASVAAASARKARFDVMSGDLRRLEDWRSILARGGAPSLPAVPLSGLDALGYRAELTPSNNRELLGSFETIAALASKRDEGGAAYTLEGATIEAGIGTIRGDLADHFDVYERFWCERVPTAMVVAPNPDLSWPEMRRTLMTSEQIRGELSDLRELMISALSYAEGNPNASERARDLLAELKRENGNDDLRSVIYSTMIPAWQGLRTEAANAGETLRRAAEGGSLINRYFPLPLSRRIAGPEEAYWRSFAVEGIEKIAFEAASAEAQAIARVTEDCRRFPITLDGAPSGGLSHDRVEAVHRTLSGVGVLTSGEDLGALEDPFAGIANDRIRMSLNQINGGALRDPVQVGRLRKALRVASFLVDNRDRLVFTLAYRGANMPRNVEAGTDVQCQQIKVEGKRGIGADSDFTFFQGPEVLGTYRWTLPLRTPARMEFVPGVNGQALTATMADWEPLAALAEQRGDPINGQAVWPLPIRLSSGREFWMGAVFSDGESARLDELKRDWLTEADWR